MTTTIKVSDELRDRLKAQAQHEGRTLGAHLSELADEYDRHARLHALREAIARTPAREMDAYLDEAREWEGAELVDGSR